MFKTLYKRYPYFCNLFIVLVLLEVTRTLDWMAWSFRRKSPDLVWWKSGTPTAIVLLLLLAQVAQGQVRPLKEQALEKFRAEQYDEAVSLLEQAAKVTPDDAEVFYYLGWFNHYRAYDSRPLKGYDYSYSARIFGYLDQALKLNPSYGDAKYFYGAECSANAFMAMQDFDAKKLRHFYKLADEKGAYPAWLKEFGRNFLNGCDENAILFTGGNADFDICMFLQLHEGLRTDITILPIGNIDRPWYVRFIKKGLKGAVKKVDLNLTDKQIMELHPFKWESTTVSIPVSESDLKEFGLAGGQQLKWQVDPDLFSDLMASKIESEKAKNRNYLSPQRAILLQIVEDNLINRPIFFSNFCSPTWYGGLDACFQNCGLVSHLTPVITRNTVYEFDYRKMKTILQDKNLLSYKTLSDNNMPRISGVISSGYYTAILNLAENYRKTGNVQGLDQLKQLFSNHLSIGYNEEVEKNVLNELGK
jgi:tetratricopeptide (TPR) repeat protein